MQITLPFPVTLRSGKVVNVIDYIPIKDQPWRCDNGCSYSRDGRYMGTGESSQDIITPLPAMSDTITIEPVRVEVGVEVLPMQKWLICWTATVHLAIVCLLSVILHVMLDARVVYYWHDLLWPVPWVEKGVEK